MKPLLIFLKKTSTPRVAALIFTVVITASIIGYVMSQRQSPQLPTKDFGVVGSPDSLRSWVEKTSVKPSMPMEFEAWSKNRTLDEHFAQARRDGYSRYMITWEPWRPVPAELGIDAQRTIQPGYSNAAIAAGDQDEYIIKFAESVAKSGLDTVYIRYAHEVNGTWYPWSHDSDNYVKAWRHIVTLFRDAGADNARFIYATNASLYQDETTWTERFWKYWPGDEYVDYVGSTMINFGGIACQQIPCSGDTKKYSVDLFKDRIQRSYELTGKHMILSEVNTALDGDTSTWLNDLAAWAADDSSHIKGIVLSQQPSRGAAQMETGDLSWNISDHPELFPALKNLIDTMTHL
jgi:mannan endo-1,4-beta-mannosidase